MNIDFYRISVPLTWQTHPKHPCTPDTAIPDILIAIGHDYMFACSWPSPVKAAEAIRQLEGVGIQDVPAIPTIDSMDSGVWTA